MLKIILLRIGIFLLLLLALPFVLVFSVPVFCAITINDKCFDGSNCFVKFIIGLLAFCIGLVLDIIAIPIAIIALPFLLVYFCCKECNERKR